MNSLDRVTSVVDEVYAKFGVVDTFEAIASYENSLEIFHCYAPNGKVDDTKRYPDYKV